MNRFKTLTAGLFVATALFATSPVLAETISGELVVLNGSSTQFRIVDHAGTFTAPSGMSLEEWDGKAVHVEVTNGRVIQITEKKIPIEPIEHGVEVVSGELLVIEGSPNRFTIAGDSRVYTAPAGVDLRAYAGKVVKVRLNENREVTNIDLAAISDSRTYANLPSESCRYGDAAFSDGTTRCLNQVGYRCDDGVWRNADGVCGEREELAIAVTCRIGDATVTEGSSICQRGRTLRCGQRGWVSTGTACR